jgi:hypothetical protein
MLSVILISGIILIILLITTYKFPPQYLFNDNNNDQYIKDKQSNLPNNDIIPTQKPIDIQSNNNIIVAHKNTNYNISEL